MKPCEFLGWSKPSGSAIMCGEPCNPRSRT
jgi:hypothetical protein